MSKNKEKTIYSSTLTKRGQITLPAKIRQALKIKPQDRVVFEVEDGQNVKLQSSDYTLEEAFSSVKKKDGVSEDFKTQEQTAKEEKAAKTIKQLKQK